MEPLSKQIQSTAQQLGNGFASLAPAIASATNTVHATLAEYAPHGLTLLQGLRPQAPPETALLASGAARPVSPHLLIKSTESTGSMGPGWIHVYNPDMAHIAALLEEAKLDFDSDDAFSPDPESAYVQATPAETVEILPPIANQSLITTSLLEVVDNDISPVANDTPPVTSEMASSSTGASIEPTPVREPTPLPPFLGPLGIDSSEELPPLVSVIPTCLSVVPEETASELLRQSPTEATSPTHMEGSSSSFCSSASHSLSSSQLAHRWTDEFLHLSASLLRGDSATAGLLRQNSDSAGVLDEVADEEARHSRELLHDAASSFEEKQSVLQTAKDDLESLAQSNGMPDSERAKLLEVTNKLKALLVP